MNTTSHSSLDQTKPSAALAPAAEQRVREFATHLETIEATVQRARDTACVLAYLTQEIPDSSKHIQLDVQALRGVMVRIWGDLDEALQSLDTAQDLFSKLAKKPNL